MPGAMRKLGLYLGLVEDDEQGRHDRHDGYPDGQYDAQYDGQYDAQGYDDGEEWAEPAAVRTPAPVRRLDVRGGGGQPETRGALAVDLRPRPVADEGAAYRITTLHPTTYNEARTIGEHFRDGTPVIMNLTEMDDVDAKRLVDFAAGLIFGLRGSIERVTNKVFLLSPQNVEVTAEDKARIAEGGFFNQS